jgi:nitronate monooxygenase
MTGADIRRAIDAGAAAVQMGTAFLACDECGAGPGYKRAVLQEHGRGTRYTRAFSGRPAQGIANEFMRRMDGADVLPFPAQNTLGAILRQKAQRENDMEYQALWAGAGYRACRAGPAKALLQALEQELHAA